jgi:uncharacterized phiE125 gp8 family phage protein
MAGWKVTTAASEAPITVTEAKEWLRVEHSVDDDLISAIVSAVTATAESYLSQALVTQTITEKYDHWGDAVLNLTMHPVQSVTSITYTDDDGATQTLSSSLYVVDTFKPRAQVRPAYNETWPTARTTPNSITVVYQAGYGDAADVPEDIKLALRLMIADAYENRTDSVRQLPTASKYLLDRKNMTYLL